jgi:hypothetical protein
MAPVLYRRQTLPASGHYGTFLVKAKLMTDCDGRNSRHARNSVETHIVILAMVYMPNVGGTCAEPSEQCGHAGARLNWSA